MNWRRIVGVSIVVILGLVAAGGSFAIGRANAPDEDDASEAKAEAYENAAAEAEETASEASRARGRAAGEKVGRLAGEEGGAAAGESAGVTAIDALGPCPSPDPDLCPVGTIGPAPQGTYCPPPFSYFMGVCTVRRPARPEECPPGQEPAGVTGACAPRE
jgi:hypothetical protein